MLTAEPVLPGRAGELRVELGERATVHDIYGPRGAQVYEALTRDDTHEIREVVRGVRRTTGPVLDLGCGAGRLTFPLLALGREVTALDRSEAMLELLAERLAEHHADRCTLVAADMTRFRLDERFGAIVLGTISISLLDPAGRSRLYEAVREHLLPGGRFLVSTVDGTGDEAETDWRFTDRRSGSSYLVIEHVRPAEGLRTVTVVPERSAAVELFTSTSRMLPADRLTNELEIAGLAVHEVQPVLGGGRRVVLIEAGA